MKFNPRKWVTVTLFAVLLVSGVPPTASAKRILPHGGIFQMSPGSPGLRQAGAKSAIGGGPLTISFPLQIGAGDAIYVACAAWTGATISVNTPTDIQGNTWSSVGNTGLNSSDFNSQMYVYKATAAGSGMDSVTCSWNSVGSGAHIDMGVLDYMSPLTTVDVSSLGNINGSSSGNTRSMTTTATDTLVAFVFSADQGADVYSGLSGYAVEIIGDATSGNTFRVYDKFQVASGSQSITVTGLGSHPQHVAFLGIE